LSLPEAQIVIGTTQDALSIRLILAVVVPEADLTNFVLPSSIKGLELAARASECLGRLLRLPYPFYWLNHDLTVLKFEATGIYRKHGQSTSRVNVPVALTRAR
jgi:hypothetical protein